jgi:hypothetical protein
MLVDKRVKAALDLKRLKLPAYPRVLRLEAEDYTDSSGDDSLRILAVIDDATELKPEIGPAVLDLKRAIRASLQKNGITVFPYIFLAKPSELTDAITEE